MQTRRRNPLALLLTPLVLAIALSVVPKTAAGQDRGRDRDQNGAEARAALSIQRDDLRAHIAALSSDEMKGRALETGGLDKAADYLIGEMKRLGFKPGGENGTYEQKFTMVSGIVQDPKTSVASRGGASVALGAKWRPLTQAEGEWKGQAIKLGAGAKPGDADLAGKIVVVPEFSTVPDRAERTRVEQLARDGKAAALVLVASRSDDSELRRLSFNFRRSLILEDIAKPSRMLVVRAAPEFLADLLGEATAKAWLDPESKAETIADKGPEWGLRLAMTDPGAAGSRATARNLCGVVPGSDPTLKSQIVMLTAHYDHIGINTRAKEGEDNIFNGADDDASGVGAILAIGKAFVQSPPKRTIAVVALTMEERGIVGSSYMAEHPLFPLENVVADVNVEMIGRLSAQGKGKFWVTGFDRSSFGPIFRTAAESVGAEAYADPYVAQNFFLRSDNISFARKGVPAHSCSTFDPMTHRDYHGVDDEVDRLDFENLELVCRGIFAGTSAIASGRETPKWVEGKRP